MRLIDRLRQIVDPLPSDASVTLTAVCLRGWLEEENAAPAYRASEELTVDELADELHRGRSTIRAWLSEEGNFPNAYRLRGREWRIPRSDVTAFLARQRPRATTEEDEGLPAPAEQPADLGAWRRHFHNGEHGPRPGRKPS